MMQLDYCADTQSLHGDDTYLSEPRYNIFGVFDGVGGYEGGDIASQLAAGAVGKYYRRLGRAATGTWQSRGHAKAALEEADRVIRKRQRVEQALGEMATTAAIANIYRSGQNYNMTYANVGDSRIYLVRNQQLSQLTRDESVGNNLTNSVGSTYGMTVNQVDTIRLESGDRILLCTDGIHGNPGSPSLLSPAEILRALNWQRSPEEAVDNLFAISRKRDDRTAIVIDIP